MAPQRGVQNHDGAKTTKIKQITMPCTEIGGLSTAPNRIPIRFNFSLANFTEYGQAVFYGLDIFHK